jgi:hypothetical protein
VSSTPSRKPQPDRKVLGAPLKEWGALAFVVVCGGVLIVKAGTSDGWRTAALGAGGGALLPLASP